VQYERIREIWRLDLESSEKAEATKEEKEKRNLIPKSLDSHEFEESQNLMYKGGSTR